MAIIIRVRKDKSNIYAYYLEMEEDQAENQGGVVLIYCFVIFLLL